jgi:hypothetical protein
MLLLLLNRASVAGTTDGVTYINVMNKQKVSSFSGLRVIAGRSNATFGGKAKVIRRKLRG